MTQKSIELDGINVVFEVHGEGPTLLFIHGYPGRPQDFRWLISELSGFQLVMLALPGLDLTPLPDMPMLSISDRADFIVRFMDLLEIKKTVVLAHSMGGVLGTEIANKHSEKIDGLVLISSVGPFPYRAYRNSKPKLASFLFNHTPLSSVLSPLMRYIFSVMGFPRGVSTDAMRYVIACAASVSFPEHAQNLGALSQPVLSIWCANDPLIEPASFQSLSEIVPDCTELYFDSGGHNPQKEHATRVAQKVKDFISLIW